MLCRTEQPRDSEFSGISNSEMFKGSSWLGLVLALTAGRFWEKWGPALSAVQEGQVCDGGLVGDPSKGRPRLWQEDPSGLQGLQVPWPELQSGPA